MSFPQGYFAGGFSNANISSIDKITYSNDTNSAQTTAVLSVARRGGAGVGDTTDGKGYFGGGASGNLGNPISLAVTDKITFSNDSCSASTSANLSQARYGIADVADDADGKGYFMGGSTNNSGTVATTDKITFSNDTTAAQTSANLTLARVYCTGVNSITRGYVAGGATAKNKIASVVNNIDSVVFSTDICSTLNSTVLSQARQGAAAVSAMQNQKGYFVSGFRSAGTAINNLLDIVAFSSNTLYSQTTATVLYGGAEGISSNNKGYCAGGGTASGGVEVVNGFKINYFNDTIASQSSANLSNAVAETTGLSGNEADPGIVTGYSMATIGFGI